MFIVKYFMFYVIFVVKPICRVRRPRRPNTIYSGVFDKQRGVEDAGLCARLPYLCFYRAARCGHRALRNSIDGLAQGGIPQLFALLFSLFTAKSAWLHSQALFVFYIFSGAEQPISVMPFFSTARAVSASFRRASSTFSVSPLMRQAL